MGAKQNYVLVLRGFVLELEQILKNDRLRVGQGRINFAKLIFKMSITIFVQNKCKNRLLTATVTSSFTSKMTKSVVKCIIQVQTRDLIVRITSNFGSITLHTKLIDSWKTVHQILFLTTAVTSLFT